MPDAADIYIEKTTLKLWKIDGLPLLVPSVMMVIWGLWGSRYSSLHYDRIGYTLFFLSLFISVDLNYNKSKSIQSLKKLFNPPPEDGGKPVHPNPSAWTPLFPEDGRPKWLRYWEWPAWAWLLIVPAALAVYLVIIFPMQQNDEVVPLPPWLVPVGLIGMGPVLWLARTPSSFPAVTGLGFPVLGLTMLLRPITAPNRWDFLLTGYGVMGTIIGTLMLVRYLRNNPATE